MRILLRKQILLLVYLLLIGDAFWPNQSVIAQSAATETMIPYAPVKRPFEMPIRRAALEFVAPLSFPRRGVLLIFSGILSQSTSWITVDIDARSIERADTTLQTMPDGERERILDSKKGATLSWVEVNMVVKLANEIWDPPPRRPDLRPPVLDAMCEVFLFDGDEVVRTYTRGDGSDPLIKAISDFKIDAISKP
jgi:hypothetical protein